MASEFCVSHDTIRGIWKRAVENFNDPDVKQFCASPQKINNCGRPQRWNRDLGGFQNSAQLGMTNRQKLSIFIGDPQVNTFCNEK